MLSAEENEFVTRVGPGTPMGNLLRRFWIPVALSEELPAPDCPPVRVKVLGEKLVAFRDSSGRVGLLREHCPHRGTSLFYGRNEANGLRCIYHGWKFDVEGRCVDMPNEPPEYDYKHKVRAIGYPCEDRGKLLWAYMGPREAMPELPHFDWFDLPPEHIWTFKWHASANWLQVLEAEVDESHAPFLHSSGEGVFALNFLNNDSPTQTNMAYLMRGRQARMFAREAAYGLDCGARRDLGPDGFFWRITRLMLPYHACVPSGTPVILFNSRIPIDDESCWSIRLRWRADRPFNEAELYGFQHSGDASHADLIPGTYRLKRDLHNDFLIDRALQHSGSYTGIRGINEQDNVAAASMGSIADRTQEHLGQSDTIVIATRRKLMKLAKALQGGVAPYASQHPEVFHGAISATGVVHEDLPFEKVLERVLEPPSVGAAGDGAAVAGHRIGEEEKKAKTNRPARERMRTKM